MTAPTLRPEPDNHSIVAWLSPQLHLPVVVYVRVDECRDDMPLHRWFEGLTPQRGEGLTWAQVWEHASRLDLLGPVVLVPMLLQEVPDAH